MSFGTSPLFATPKRLRMIADAIGAAGAGAVITGIEPRELGVLADGVVAHRFVPQSALLPHCDAVICHAGAGTLLGALARVLPLLLVPVGANHLANPYDRTFALGLAAGEVSDLAEFLKSLPND